VIVEVRTPRTQAPALRRAFENSIQQDALRATDRAAASAKTRIRTEMAAAGLGRLGNALGSGSDLKQSGVVHRRGDSWSASGWVFVRSGSKRSRGAIEAYTEGANIRARNPSGLLWFPTDDIMRYARVPLPSSGGNSSGRVRLTPKLWDRTYAARFGRLFRIGNTLFVKNATLSLAGKPRSLKARTKRGKVPKGQVGRELIAAFIGIPQTSRSARIDPRAIVQAVATDSIRRDFALFVGNGRGAA
jgi:hypothetical protein